jgi:predicted RNase H-like HicB family nuclease
MDHLSFHITNHAKKRRPHHIPKTDQFFIDILTYFDLVLNFKDLSNGKYKISGFSGAAVINKKNNQIVLITYRGQTTFDSPETKLNIRLITDEEDNRKSALTALKKIRAQWMQYYPAIFKESSTGYSIHFPDVPNCIIISGLSLETAITTAKVQIAMHLYVMYASGLSVPTVNLNLCKDQAKGHILVMIRPDKNNFKLK